MMDDNSMVLSPSAKKKRPNTVPTFSTSIESSNSEGVKVGANAVPLELINSTLYMALKHVIWYTNSLFSIKSNSDLQQSYKSAELAQRYINAAVSSISPYEPLNTYVLKRPLADLNSIEHIPFKNDDYCPSEVSTLDYPNEDLFKQTDTEHVDDISSIATLLDIQMDKSQAETDRQLVLPGNNTVDELEFTSDSSISNIETPISKAVTKFKEYINTSVQMPEKITQTEWSRTDFPFSPLVESIRLNFFKYPSFRGIQLQAINAILSGQDVFVCMATGGGKSLCYQLPPLVFGGVAVVFSPLISLIKDQIKHLQEIGLNCVENVTTYKTLMNFNVKGKSGNGLIWFMTPEKYSSSIRTNAFLQKLYDENQLRLFAVDEAHCISQWGTDFRKDYRKLGSLRTKFPRVPIIALTATSPPNITRDILSTLKIPKAVCLNSTIHRKNLWLEVRTKSKSKSQLLEIVKLLRNIKESAIIYCLSTRDCERVSNELINSGISSGVYHSKMDNNTRLTTQQDWMNNKIRVVVATLSFGMGIDKSNVRFIFHHSPPSSLDRYYQEIGRAGRDGKYARTILWYSPHDFNRLKSLVQGKPKFASAIDQVANYCYNRLECRHKLISKFLDPDSEVNENCTVNDVSGCDNCTRRYRPFREDVTIQAREVAKFVSQAMANRNNPFLTVAILINALRGSNMKIVLKYGLDRLPGHGSLKGATKEKIMEIVRKLLSVDVLTESHRRSKNFGRTVVNVGKNAHQLINGNTRIYIDAVRGEEDEDNDDTIKPSVIEAASCNNIKRSIPLELL